MDSEECERRRGVSGGSGRVLKWLAPSAQCADSNSLGACLFCVKESASGHVVEALDHGVGDLLGEAEVAHVGGGFVGVHASRDGVCVIIEQARDFAMSGRRIRVSDHVK